MVITMEAKRQHEEAENQNSSPQVMNSNPHPGGGTVSGDTVTYVNEGAN